MDGGSGGLSWQRVFQADIVTNCDIAGGCGMVDLLQVFAIVAGLVLIAGWFMGGLNVEMPDYSDD